MSHSLQHSSTNHQHVAKGSEVFVGGLAHTVTELKLVELFSSCGEIAEIRLIKDQKGNVKGFGFVRFTTKEAASKAVKEKTGVLLEGKKIGVLPSTEQDTLFLGNLYKGWTAEEFEKIVRQVFADVVSVNLVMLKDGQSGQNQLNRGFGFIKFSSHAAAARAHRVGSKPDFLLAGNLHPSVKWAEEEPDVDPEELAKIKIAFIRNLPNDADEIYLQKLFGPFGKVDKVVISRKGKASVGFIHFANRLDLERAIEELNEKPVQGPNGGPTYKIQVEVARPLDKKRKRACEDSESKEPSETPIIYTVLKEDLGVNLSVAHKPIQKELEYVDPYEAAIVALPLAVKERLLRILRLGIATKFDIGIQSLMSIKELPESSAISVLDQFMLSGAESQHKSAYLAGLISKFQVDRAGLNRLPVSLSRIGDVTSREADIPSFPSQIHLPAVDSLTPDIGSYLPRSDSYASRYSSLFLDYPLSSRATVRREPSSSPLRITPPSSSSPHVTGAADTQPPRRQLRFDPFTGEPFRFDPFTGEPILPERPLRRF